MIDFARGRSGVFTSASLAAHLFRGGAAAGLIAVALAFQASYPWASLAAGIGALVAIRGCPVCWTLGLFETVLRKARPQDSRPSAKRA
jgi:hypothetical protein